MFSNLFVGLRLQPSCDGQKVYLFFFGKKPFLSNIHECTINLDGTIFQSAEQAFQFTKAKFFKNDQVAANIMTMSNATDIIHAGQKVQRDAENRKDWEQHENDVLRKILRAKFKQNPVLFEMLKSTGSTVLVEANPYDRHFGIGLGMNNHSINCHHNWTGENVIGKLLEEIRSEDEL